MRLSPHPTLSLPSKPLVHLQCGSQTTDQPCTPQTFTLPVCHSAETEASDGPPFPKMPISSSTSPQKGRGCRGADKKMGASTAEVLKNIYGIMCPKKVGRGPSFAPLSDRDCRRGSSA